MTDSIKRMNNNKMQTRIGKTCLEIGLHIETDQFDSTKFWKIEGYCISKLEKVIKMEEIISPYMWETMMWHVKGDHSQLKQKHYRKFS